MKGTLKFLEALGVEELELCALPFVGMLIPAAHRPGHFRSLLVNKNLTDTEKLVTLLHEIIHACQPEWGENEVMADELRIYEILEIKNPYQVPEAAR